MADPQRTEQPTPRKLEKSRSEGQFPVSKEFVAGLVFLVFVWLLQSYAGPAFAMLARMMRQIIGQAFRVELTAQLLSHWLGQWSWQYFAYFFMAGVVLTALTAALHLATTGFGIAWKKLSLDFKRLNPTSRLSQLPGQNFTTFLQAAVLLPIFLWIVYRIIVAQWDGFLTLPRMPLAQGLGQAGSAIGSLLWKAAIVFVVIGCIDLMRQRRRWMGQLRMTKQEIREEQKESEGNPLIRMRIRRLQREALRQRMMQEVPKATAVIVNPTHYAVAIRYQVSAGGAPKVVAKGRDLVALRIRDIAVRNQVPIVENPPLARSLYQSVETGQEIPPHLYQAVAEVLAYIYRLLRGNLPGQ